MRNRISNQNHTFKYKKPVKVSNARVTELATRINRRVSKLEQVIKDFEFVLKDTNFCFELCIGTIGKKDVSSTYKKNTSS